MSEHVRREHAVMSPTACVFCGTYDSAVIDTGVDLLGYGRINICTRNDDHGVGCAEIIGRLGGNLIDRSEYELILADAGGKAAKILELEDELANARRLEQEHVDAIRAAIRDSEKPTKKAPAKR